MGSRFIEQYAFDLETEDSAEVVKRIQSHYRTSCSVDKMLSNVRTQFLRNQSGRPRRKELVKKLDTLRRVVHDSGDVQCQKKIDAFLESSPKEQYDIVRHHKRKDFCDSAAVNSALREVQVLPDNVRKMRLDSDEARVCREEQKMALIEKNANVIHIEDADALLVRMRQLIDSNKGGVAEVALALMFLSGRRSAEILNYRSVFEPLDGHSHLCYFVGQLKKNTQEERKQRYVIPLLCDFHLFEKGIRYMRSLKSQRHIAATRAAKGDAAYDNKQIAKKYTSQLHYMQKKKFPHLNKSHDLRALYVLYVHNLFEHTLSLPLLCKIVLIHDDMNESVHYSAIRLTGFVAPKLGKLHKHLFPQFTRLKSRP